MKKKIRWIKMGPDRWESTEGIYALWVQARPRDDGLHYASQRIGVKYPWLCEHGTRAEAIDECEKDAEKHLAKGLAQS